MRESGTQVTAQIDAGAVLVGFLFGLIFGALAALFKVPQSGDATRQNLGQNLRTRLEAVAPGDPIAESIAEGKAAAHRRQEELGLKR